MSTYWISTLQKGPSMNRDHEEIEADSYKNAVSMMHEKFKKIRRPMSLHSDKYCVYSWHMINADGHCTDRNLNGGAPNGVTI